MYFVYVSIIEHPFKITSNLDGQFADDIREKIEQFSLFKSYKAIAKEMSGELLLKYGENFYGEVKCLSFHTAEVIFINIKIFLSFLVV